MDLWKKVLRSELSLLGRNLWKNLWFYHQVPEGQPPKKTKKTQEKNRRGRAKSERPLAVCLMINKSDTPP